MYSQSGVSPGAPPGAPPGPYGYQTATQNTNFENPYAGSQRMPFNPGQQPVGMPVDLRLQYGETQSMPINPGAQFQSPYQSNEFHGPGNVPSQMMYASGVNANQTSTPFSYATPSTASFGSNLSTPPMGAGNCVTQVELSIKCRSLMDKDVLSKSDPMVSVSMAINGRWIEKGRTENIKNSLNPDFSRKIKLDYYFEETQKLRFDVFDIDNLTPALSDDDFLGTMECTLGQIVTSVLYTKPLMYYNGTKMGNSTISIYAEEVDLSNREVLQLTFKAQHLDNKDFFGKSDPFLEIHKPGLDGKWQMVHRTETIKNNLNPVWRPFEIRQQSIGGNNIETQLLLLCYDHESSGTHDYIGECVLTLGALLEAQHEAKSWPCINTKKQKKKGAKYKNSGTIILTSCKVSKAHSFLDYVFGGTQINFTVAIDFTASNGDPRQPSSLHYMHPSQPNEYTSAILAVGGVVQDYDSDKMFPALGFGAKTPPHFQVSHEFALNFNMANPFCSGVQGLVQAYQNCLMQVQLYGPTNFAPVIRHVANFAQQADQQNYFVLLILTDGVVTDMPDTCRVIVQASNLPMSIIIVGVGKADFSNMNFLDGDGELLRAADGTRAIRDIVQFVPYYKFKNGDPALLAKEVLAEVPHQLTEYFRLRNIAPKPARQNPTPI